MQLITRTALVGAALALVACSDRTAPSPLANEGQRLMLSLTNSNTDGGALMLDPRTATLHVGYGILISVNITDADGNTVTGVRPTWRSTDPSVVQVAALPDSGFANDGLRASVAGVAAGTARVIVSYGAAADTAYITVAPARNPGNNNGGGTTPRPTSFEAGIYISTAVDSNTFAIWRREPVANATVKLIRVPLQEGDTIPDGVPTVAEPTLFQTLVSDDDGFVIFRNVPMGRFRVEVQPPAGGGWQPLSLEYSVPWTSSMRVEIRLPKH